MLKKLTFLLALLSFPCAMADVAKMPEFDEHTLMLLTANADGPVLAGPNKEGVSMRSGKIVSDERFGHVIEFVDKDDQSISITDNGRFDFTKGFTFEAWIKLAESATVSNKGAELANKRGSFLFYLNENLGLDNKEIRFPRVPIVTTDKKQLNYFPVDNCLFNGSTSIPTEQWAHIAMTYDADRKVIRSWIDGTEDRNRYLTRGEYGTTMQCDPKAPLTLLRGIKDVKLGAVRISSIARKIGPVNLLETYVHQLLYQKRIVLQFAHLGSNLPYPLQTTVTWEKPTGSAQVIYRGSLDGPEDKLIELEGVGWNNDYFNLHIRVTAENQQIYHRFARVTNGIVGGERRIDVRPDKRIGMDGKAVFPMMIYHVFPEDFQLMAEMGFHYVTPRAPDSPFFDFGRDRESEYANMKLSLDAAEKAGIKLIMPTRISQLKTVFRFSDHPALGAWASYDEPWGVSLDKMVDSYNAVKMIDPNLPIMTAQNNLSRMAETAEGLDILACDPYPTPSVSLRMVADATKASRRAVADLKPVWTLVNQYPTKLPTLQEMRCMLYLAVAAGADGLGIYAWDYRMSRGTEILDGWHTSEHPEHLEILKTAMKEFTAIQNVLVIPNTSTGFQFTEPNPAIHAALKKSTNGTYLVIANDSRGAEKAVLKLEGMTNATATNLTDGSTLKISDGSLVLNLEPLSSGAYKVE